MGPDWVQIRREGIAVLADESILMVLGGGNLVQPHHLDPLHKEMVSCGSSWHGTGGMEVGLRLGSWMDETALASSID